MYNFDLEIQERYMIYVEDCDILFDGIHVELHFPNNYGASIINHKNSYGESRNLYELAVIIKKENEWPLCYDTEIASDVLGWLTSEEIQKVLDQIFALEKVNSPSVFKVIAWKILEKLDHTINHNFLEKIFCLFPVKNKKGESSISFLLWEKISYSFCLWIYFDLYNKWFPNNELGYYKKGEDNENL
jgi:hypothetical protein